VRLLTLMSDLGGHSPELDGSGNNCPEED